MRATCLYPMLLVVFASSLASGCVGDNVRRGRSTAEVTRTPRRTGSTGSEPSRPSRSGGADAGVQRTDGGAEAQPTELVAASEPDAGPEPEPEPPPAPAPADVRHQLRLAIDDHSAAILGCLGSHAGALDLEWTAEGVFTVSLRPPHRAGEDVAREEECVAVALRDLTLPAGAAAGSLIHAIEAP